MSMYDEQIAHEVVNELRAARLVHGPMRSPHEGWAVIKEEEEELWLEIKERHIDLDAMRKEAIQLAAMAIRFVQDVCDPLIQKTS